MSLTLRIENMANLPDGGPLTYTLTGQRGADIGRDPHLDWTLPDPSRHVSGTHCEIRYEDGGYLLRDVSANGTFLNGSDHRIQSPYRLKSGDRLTIGDYIVAVDVMGESVPDPVSYAGPPPAFEDLWSVESVVPPLDPREFRPAADAKPIKPDFLEWAVDVPNAPGVGFVARAPASAQPVAQPQTDTWNPPAAAVPKPRRSIWVSSEPSGPWGEGPVEPPAAVAEAPPGVPVANVGVSAASPPVREPVAEIREPIPAGSPDGSALLARFAKGANLPPNWISAQEAGDLMERLGRVLLQVTTSIKQLLDARSQSKRLAGSSSHTMIAALDNNPLKFSPTPAEAMRIMLGPPSTSYLDAEQAFIQGFDDLKTHQIKVLSAMQLALERLVDDLDPKSIEESLGETKGPMSWIGFQKAQFWTVYKSRWQSKKSRHGGGLRELFMEYFAECYDQTTPNPQK